MSAPAVVDLVEPEPGLRERKKLETRRALIDATIDLSSRRGFDDTTVDDIAAAVGVSARTFHRYFVRKEDAVLGDSADRLARFREQLAEADGTVFDGIRVAVVASAAELVAGAERERAKARLVAATPALRAHNLGLYDEWAAAITAHAASAVGEHVTDRWPATVGAATMAALSSAVRRWAVVDGLDLVAEYHGVLDLLSGLDRPRRPTGGRR